jgi:hypothetical protein
MAELASDSTVAIKLTLNMNVTLTRCSSVFQVTFCLGSNYFLYTMIAETTVLFKEDLSPTYVRAKCRQNKLLFKNTRNSQVYVRPSASNVA